MSPTHITDDFRERRSRYVTVAVRWLLVSSAIFMGVMSAGVYVTNHMLAKVYSATASLQVETKTGGKEAAYSGWAFTSPQSRAIQAELTSIESPEILRGVIDELDLEKVWAERVFHRSDPLTADEAVHYLTSHLRPKFKHDSHAVEVTALSDDPKEAAQIANEVVELYKVSRAELAREEALAPGDTPTLPPGTVKITGHANVPSEPTSPNKRFCYAIAAGFAAMLGVMIASSIEVCLLIARAEAAHGELQPPR